MSQLHHTPGPWELVNFDGEYNSIDRIDANGESIIFPMGYETDGIFIEPANARLIAAAPEMLEALIYMCHLGYTCDKMTIAIERATGKKIEDILKDEAEA